MTVVTEVTDVTKQLCTPKKLTLPKFYLPTYLCDSSYSCDSSGSSDGSDSNNQNIVRIAKRWPENITSVVKSVKLLFTRVVKKHICYSSDSSDSMDSSEKNNPTCPQKNHATFIYFFFN